MIHLMALSFSELLTKIGDWIVTEGLKIVFALIVFLLFCAIIRVIFKKIDKRLQKKHVDETIRRISIPWIRRILIFIGFATLLTYLGIETSSIAAAITSIGLTIGLALQGSLSNIAGGVVVIVLRPYKIGDYIECNGESGTVEEIRLFHTYLRTGDNKIVVIPNGTAGNSVIVNYSTIATRRDDIIFSIAYDNDFDKAKELIMQCIKNCPLIMEDPEPFVNVQAHSASSIDILARYFTKNEDFWTAHWYMMEAVKKAFDENGISIPYPQLDLHIKPEDMSKLGK